MKPLQHSLHIWILRFPVVDIQKEISGRDFKTNAVIVPFFCRFLRFFVWDPSVGIFFICAGGRAGCGAGDFRLLSLACFQVPAEPDGHGFQFIHIHRLTSFLW